MKHHFTLDPNITYLNTGTHSFSPKKILKAITRYQTQYERNPTWALMQNWERMWKVQTAVAGFFGTDPKQIILRPNVTESMQTVILGLHLPAGSEVLATNLEYGAITRLLRFFCERGGHKLSTVVLPLLDGNKPIAPQSYVEHILKSVTPQTRLVVVSHIFTGTGHRLPLEHLAQELHRRGVFLVVDGAHSAGALPLDFSSPEYAHVSAFAANFHKWCLGPKGTGFAWVNKDFKKHLSPSQPGWATYGVLPHMAAFGDCDDFQHKFMLSSCLDFTPYYALQDMVAFWKACGPKKIRRTLEEITSYTMQVFDRALCDLGFVRLTPDASPQRGPLVSYLLPKRLQALGPTYQVELYKKLKLQVAVHPLLDQYVLRLSPYVYNTKPQILRAAQRLAKFFK